MVGTLILLALVLVVELSILVYPPLFPLGLNVLGKDPLCSAAEVFKGAKVHCSILEDASSETFDMDTVRADNGLQLVRTSKGNWWIPEGDDPFLPDLLSQQENNLYGDGQNAVQPGDVVLDCGAHVGLFTRKALEMGASIVVAIEISPRNIECLRRNFEEEIRSGRVIVYPKGVWNKEDLLTLYSSSRNSAGDSVVITDHRSAVETHVPLTTIDRLVEELDLEDVDFIKMDIKGAAAKALEGAEKTLREHGPKLAIATEEISDHPDLIARVISRLQPGYELHCGACTASPGVFTWLDLATGLQGYRVYPLVLFFSPQYSAKGGVL
jgi:FkbM family methyltransferase